MPPESSRQGQKLLLSLIGAVCAFLATQKIMFHSKEKEAKLCEELNLNKTVQSLVVRILEFKKQKRGIEKNITKLEKELERLFDESHIDCLEVEYGLLVRRKKEQGYEWVVEI